MLFIAAGNNVKVGARQAVCENPLGIGNAMQTVRTHMSMRHAFGMVSSANLDEYYVCLSPGLSPMIKPAAQFPPKIVSHTGI